MKDFYAQDYVRPNLNVEEIEKIKAQFDVLDGNGNGIISVMELIMAMKQMGFDTKNPAIFQLISDLENDEETGISFEDYLNMMAHKLGNDNDENIIKRAFELFDEDSKDYISPENIRKIANELGDDLNDEDIANIIQKNDLNGDGKLSYEDFFKVMTQKTFKQQQQKNN